MGANCLTCLRTLADGVEDYCSEECEILGTSDVGVPNFARMDGGDAYPTKCLSVAPSAEGTGGMQDDEVARLRRELRDAQATIQSLRDRLHRRRQSLLGLAMVWRCEGED